MSEGFLKSFTGKLTALSALLFVLITIGTQVERIAGWMDKPWKYVSSLAGLGAACHTTDVETPKRVPYSLRNFINSRDHDFLYWFLLVVDNSKCKEPLHLSVEFKVREGPATATAEPAAYTINAGKSLTERVNPGFEFENPGLVEDAVLSVSWYIYSGEPRQFVRKDTREIEVLARNRIVWDLTSSKGPVPRSFLLASLTAWTLAPEKPLLDDGTSGCIDNIAELSQCLQSHYERLFGSPEWVKVTPYRGNFPPEGVQVVRTPVEVLTSKRATPLEAALLLTAAIRQVMDVSTIALFTVPNDVNSVAFLLGWDEGGGNWYAISLMPAAVRHSFDGNRDESTLQLRAILEKQPELVAILGREGVFSGNGITALQFEIAKKLWKIRGLPLR